MTTNNDIRKFLGLPEEELEFIVDQVDSLCPRSNTLMFLNKSGYNLFDLDHQMINCVVLIDESYGEFTSAYANDFISIKNPKYHFCRVVENRHLPSGFQREFRNVFKDDLKNTYLYPQYHCQEVLIGKNCQIDPGVIIGGTDFSPVIGKSRNELIQFPQLGGVKIDDDVVIKYNTMVGKGTFGFTKIGKNTMIDFGCQIGHNCEIGDSCIIAAGTIIGGSTKVGNRTTIGIGAKIRNGITIGDDVSIGMGSVVIKDVPSGSVVVGNPARVIEHKHIIDEKGLV